MGRELRLITVDVLSAYVRSGSSATWRGISQATLELPRLDEGGYERIDLLPAAPIPSFVEVRSWIGDRASGRLTEGIVRRTDGNGAPLTWVRAGKLKPVLKKYFKDRPATAYIRALPDDTMVILDWH